MVFSSGFKTARNTGERLVGVDRYKFRNPDLGKLKNHHIQFIQSDLHQIMKNGGGKLFPAPKWPFLKFFLPQFRFLAVPGNKYGDSRFSQG